MTIEALRASLAAAGQATLGPDTPGVGAMPEAWTDYLLTDTLELHDVQDPAPGDPLVVHANADWLGTLRAVRLTFFPADPATGEETASIVEWIGAVDDWSPADLYLLPPDPAITGPAFGELLRSLRLRGAQVLFSTCDLSGAFGAGAPVPLPPWLKGARPYPGFTCSGRLALPESIATALERLIGKLPELEVIARVYVRGGYLWFELQHAFDAAARPGLAPFGSAGPRAALREIIIGCPIDGWATAGPAVTLGLQLEQGSAALAIEIRIDLSDHTASLHAASSPGHPLGVDWLAGTLGFSLDALAPFGLGALSLQSLTAALDLETQKLSQYAVELAAAQPVSIIGDALRLRPVVRVEALAGEAASLALTGEWHMGSAVLDTHIDVRTGLFGATLQPGSALDLSALVPGGLPPFLTSDLVLLDLDVAGSIATGSFRGHVETTGELALHLGDQVLGIADVALTIDRAPRQVSVTATGRLEILDFRVSVRAVIAETTTLLFAVPEAHFEGVANLFLREIGASAQMGAFALADIAVSVTRPDNAFDVSARIAEPITLGSPHWAIESARFDVARDASGTQAFIHGEVLLAGETLELEALYESAAGWRYRGSTDARIPVSRLAADLAGKLGVPFPASLRDGLVVTHLALEHASRPARFAFDARGKLDLPDLAVDLALHLDVDPGKTLAAAGSLTAGRQQFMLQVDSGASTRLAGTWTGRVTLSGLFDDLGIPLGPLRPPAALDLALARLALGYDATDGALTFDVATERFGDAFLATFRDGEGRAYGFGLNAAGGVPLSALPLVGGLFEAAGVRIEGVHLWLASAPDSQRERLAGLLPGKFARAGTTPGGAGLRLRLDLALAGQVRALTLQLTGSDDDGAPPLQSGAAESAPSAASSTRWFTVNKTLAGFSLARVGVAYADGALALLIDCTMALGPIRLGLLGLGASSPLDRFALAPQLAGITVAYDAGALAIVGGLARDAGGAYAGHVNVRTEAFTLAATGAYDTRGGDSLFVFGLLQRPLGGPPYCYVHGLALGFGYNSRLALPPVEQLQDFALIQAAMGKGGFAPDADAASALGTLDKSVQHSPGNLWLAAGVRFSSFEQVQSFALLTVSFGAHLEVALAGLSRLTMPPKAAAPIAYAELAILGRWDPAHHLLAVEGRLTPGSFIFSRDCHLTGGFAFQAWYGGDNEGDFVFTLGGYHPRFAAPPHYPAVPRLALNWRVSNQLQVKGSSYFAITPRGLMAGGTLDAVWQSGDLRAWFSAAADFLLYWEPFHYEADLAVSLGASYRVDLWLTSFTMSVSLGVTLHLAGPPFGGSVHVDLSVVSFTISFGAADSPPEPLSWDAFRTRFLPAAPCTIAVGDGLLRRLPVAGDDDTPRWVADPVRLRLSTSTAVPAQDGDAPWLGIGPSAIQASGFHSDHVVVIEWDDGSGWKTCAGETDPFDVVPQRRKVPATLWRGDARRGEKPALEGPALLDRKAVCGTEIAPRRDAQRATVPVALGKLNFIQTAALHWSTPPEGAAGAAVDDTDLAVLLRRGEQARASLRAALAALGVPCGDEDGRGALTDAPALCALGAE